MPIYSYSRLSCFEQCRLRYKYLYIDNIKKNRVSIEAYLGNRFHEVMEKLYLDIKHKDISLDDLKKYYEEVWSKNLTKKELFITSKDLNLNDYKNIGIKAIENYYDRYKPFNDGKTLGLEREILIDLDSGGKYKLKCIIDRLVETEDDYLEIHDYKTSSTLPEQKDLDHDVQLGLYEIAVRKAWPSTKDVELVWHYVGFDKELRSKRNSDELEQLKKRTIDLIDQVEVNTDFSPHESVLCNWCEYRETCPLFFHKIKIEKLDKNEFEKEGGVKLVDEYSKLEAEKTELEENISKIELKKERLKKAIINVATEEKITRLYGSEKQITIKNDIKVNYPKTNEIKRAEFERLMKEHGLWDKIVTESISWTHLKNMVKKGELAKGIPDSLKDYIEVEEVKQLYLAEIKKEEE